MGRCSVLSGNRLFGAVASPSANPVGGQRGRWIHLHRFPWKRKRVALAALPVTAMLAMAGIAGASVPVPSSPDEGPEAGVAGGQPTAVTLKAQRHVMANRAVTFRGHVSPASSRRVVVRVGSRRLRAR